MTKRTFDILAYIGRIAIPALATLVLVVTEIWNLPYGEAISGTLMAISAFMNALLKISTNKYEATLIGEQRTDDDRSDDAPNFGEVK